MVISRETVTRSVAAGDGKVRLAFVVVIVVVVVVVVVVFVCLFVCVFFVSSIVGRLIK